MTSILVRNGPDHIHSQLKVRARKNRRSLAAEVLTLLEAGLVSRSDPLGPDQLDQMRVKGAFPLTQQFLDDSIDEGRP
jgi:plasmid stability protein